MIYYLRIYWLLILQHFKSKMSYKVDFFVSNIGIAFSNFLSIFILVVILENTSSIGGWEKPELIFLYGFVQLTTFPSQLCLDNLWNLSNYLREGGFIKFYLKPLNPLFFYISEVLDLKALSQVLIGAACLYYYYSGENANFSYFLAMELFVYWLCSSIIYGSTLIIYASTGFWTLSPTSALMFITKVKDMAHYPMSIFSTGFKFFFSLFIPIGLFGYYPGKIYLQDFNFINLLLLLATTLFFYVIAIKLWKKGIYNFNSSAT